MLGVLCGVVAAVVVVHKFIDFYFDAKIRKGKKELGDLFKMIREYEVAMSKYPQISWKAWLKLNYGSEDVLEVLKRNKGESR